MLQINSSSSKGFNQTSEGTKYSTKEPKSFEQECKYFGVDPNNVDYQTFMSKIKEAQKTHPDHGHDEELSKIINSVKNKYKQNENLFNQEKKEYLLFENDDYAPSINPNTANQYLHALTEPFLKQGMDLTDSARQTYKQLFQDHAYFSETKRDENGQDTITKPGLDFLYETLLSSPIRLPRERVTGQNLVTITERELHNLKEGARATLDPDTILSQYKFLDLTYKMNNQKPPTESAEKIRDTAIESGKLLVEYIGVKDDNDYRLNQFKRDMVKIEKLGEDSEFTKRVGTDFIKSVYENSSKHLEGHLKYYEKHNNTEAVEQVQKRQGILNLFYQQD